MHMHVCVHGEVVSAVCNSQSRTQVCPSAGVDVAMSGALACVACRISGLMTSQHDVMSIRREFVEVPLAAYCVLEFGVCMCVCVCVCACVCVCV